MKYLLTVRGRQRLQEWAGRHPLLGFDLDGTLAPIVADPDSVTIPPTILSSLRDLARCLPVVIVSGRARKDAFQRLAGVPVREVYGNHGIEPNHAAASLLDQVAGWRDLLRERLSSMQGVWVEDKKYSLSVHYRHAPMPAAARSAIEHAAESLVGVRLLHGKRCLNVLPAGLAHKGNALLDAQRRLGCDSAIFFGDDLTDEDVFATCDPELVLGIRIGMQSTSRAAYYLRKQREIAFALQILQQSIT